MPKVSHKVSTVRSSTTTGKPTRLHSNLVRVAKIPLPRPLAALFGELNPYQAKAKAIALSLSLKGTLERGELSLREYDEVLSLAGHLCAHWHKCRTKLDDGWMEAHMHELAFGPRSGALRQNLSRLLKTTKAK